MSLSQIDRISASHAEDSFKEHHPGTESAAHPPTHTSTGPRASPPQAVSELERGLIELGCALDAASHCPSTSSPSPPHPSQTFFIELQRHECLLAEVEARLLLRIVNLETQLSLAIEALAALTR